MLIAPRLLSQDGYILDLESFSSAFTLEFQSLQQIWRSSVGPPKIQAVFPLWVLVGPIAYFPLVSTNKYSETCLIRHALSEKFCVGIDRVTDYTVKKYIKIVEYNM